MVNGYYYDLSQSEDIMNTFNNMNPIYLELMQMDNKIFGFPINLSIISMTSYEKEYEKLSFASIEKLIDFNDQQRDLLGMQQPVAIGYDPFFSRYFYMNLYKYLDFNKMHIDFSKINFNLLLEYKHLLIDNNILKDENGDTILAENHILFDSINSQNINKQANHHAYPNILNNPTPNNVALITFYSINPNSNNIDACLDFFDIIANTDFGKLELAYIPLFSDEKYYKNLTEENTEFKQGNLDKMKIYNNSKCYWAFNGQSQIFPILLSIYNEEINVHDGVAQMQAIMDLISEEYTLQSIE